MNRETILKIYSDLIADNKEKRAYVDGVLKGLQLMRDNLLIRIDEETSTLENPIPNISEKSGRTKENTVNSDGVIIDVYY